MKVEYLPLVLNLIIGIVAVSPVIYMLWSFRNSQPTQKDILLFGLGLISWATLIFIWLSYSLTSMEATTANNLQEQGIKDGAVFIFKVWVFIFPAVTLAIGANLLTHYILSIKST